jgi:hypothetical protein
VAREPLKMILMKEEFVFVVLSRVPFVTPSRKIERSLLTQDAANFMMMPRARIE